MTRLAQVYMPVSRRYACFNPRCPLVQRKNKNNSGALDSIKAHINASVDGAGNKQKHRDALSASDLLSLSVSFFGHDQRVTDKLPPRVRLLASSLCPTSIPGTVNCAHQCGAAECALY